VDAAFGWRAEWDSNPRHED